jgi:hypothetical protein
MPASSYASSAAFMHSARTASLVITIHAHVPATRLFQRDSVGEGHESAFTGASVCEHPVEFNDWRTTRMKWGRKRAT